jgi:radical SAM protein with 4Fe4S-binding SPASM domain
MREEGRFALRKEYFGGLLIDYKYKKFYILDSKQFRLLKDLSEKKIKKANVDDQKFVKEMEDIDLFQVINKNTIQLNSQYSNKIRIIKIKKIPLDYLSAPLKVYHTYTRKCNLSCKHCYAFSSPLIKERKLTLTQLEKIVKKFYNVGVIEWNFTGGEPTVEKNFLSAVKIIKKYKMKISLNTNGCLNEALLDSLVKGGVEEFIISIDGNRKAVEERRGKGVFENVINTLEYLSYIREIYPIRVILNMAVGRDNIKTVGFVAKLGAKYKFDVKYVPIKPIGRYSANLMLNKEEYMRFANLINQLRNNEKIKRSGIMLILNHKDLFNESLKDRSNLPYPFNFSQCTALTTAIDILPDGRVVPCSFLMNFSEYFGPNILYTSVEKAWMHPKMNLFRKSYMEKCEKCIFYKKRCRGVCRSTILLNGGKINKNGKIIGDDPYCFVDIMRNLKAN